MRRRLFTVGDAEAAGMTRAGLRWGERTGQWRRVARAVYIEGSAPPDDLDVARAQVLSARGVAAGALAGILHGLDGVALDGRPMRRRVLAPDRLMTVDGLPCVDAIQALVDLAAVLDDDRWEQALESALRKRIVSVHALEAELLSLGRSRTPGTSRIRRVLGGRPADAPPTESLLETLMVQLARGVEELGDPVRQHEVFDREGAFVARVDLCWPDPGLFLELDGQHHRDQPVHDARRETAVVAATGWLPGRFTWYEVVHVPATTRRRLRDIADQARRRYSQPMPSWLLSRP